MIFDKECVVIRSQYTHPCSKGRDNFYEPCETDTENYNIVFALNRAHVGDCNRVRLGRRSIHKTQDRCVFPTSMKNSCSSARVVAPVKPSNVPCSANFFAALMKPPQDARASAPRTPTRAEPNDSA